MNETLNDQTTSPPVSSSKRRFGGWRFVATLGEAIVAVGCVLLATYGLTQWAEAHANRPAQPRADGKIRLLVYRAELSDGLEPVPTKLEEQTSDFAYHYGRELQAERESRVVREWSGPEDFTQWAFSVETPGEYDMAVEFRPLNGAAAGTFQVSVDEQKFTVTVSSDNMSERRVAPHVVGRVRFEKPGVHMLTIRPVAPVSESLMALRGVTLRPVR